MIWNCQGKRISATISVFTFWHFNMPESLFLFQNQRQGVFSNWHGKGISAEISVSTFWNCNMPKKTNKCQIWLENAKTSQILNFWPKIKSEGYFEIVMAREFKPQFQFLHFGTLKSQKRQEKCQKWPENSKTSQNPYFYSKIKGKGCFQIGMARAFQLRS